MREKLKAVLQRVRNLGAKALAAVRSEIGFREVLCFSGIACFGYGLSMVYPPAAWCAVGAALFWMAQRGANVSA